MRVHCLVFGQSKGWTTVSRVAEKSEVKHAKRVYREQPGETSYKRTSGPVTSG
jgi:hypothetical protein